jgi:glycosyltransferase involved in cell wall biosynthesis
MAWLTSFHSTGRWGDRVRVALVGPYPPLRGGIVAHTAGVARALRAADHEVSIIGYRRIYPGRPIGELTGFASREKDGQAAALIDTLDPRSWIEARCCLLRRQPDAVILQWWHPLVAPALRVLLTGLRKPVVVICHNACPHERFPAWRLLRWLLFRRVDAFLFHSRAVAQALARDGYFQESIETPMPLLLCAERNLAPPGSARERLGLSDGAPLALFMGHMRGYKGIDLLLRAWSLARLPVGSRLVIAGEIPKWSFGPSKLAGMHRRCSNSVTIIGRYVEDREFCELLESAHVLVLPYRRSSQSGTLPMGLAVGLRVVASDAGGLSSPLPLDSVHEVFRAGDSDALARALERSMWGAREEILKGHVHLSAESAMSMSAFEESWRPVVRCLEALWGSGSATGSALRASDDSAGQPVRESVVAPLGTHAYGARMARDSMRPRLGPRWLGRTRV